MPQVTKTKKKLLGEFFVEAGLVTQDQIKQALEHQKKIGMRIGHALLDMGFIKEEDLIAVLGKQLGLPHIDISKYQDKPEVVNLIPERIARRYELIALDKVGDTLTVGMVDPLNVFAIDEVQRITSCRVGPIVCTKSGIASAIDKYYKSRPEAPLKKAASGGMVDISLVPPEETKELETVEEGPEVIDVVNSIIEMAVKERASDIHLEPEEDKLRVRLRIDGMLHEVKTLSKDSHPAIVSRIKVLSGLDISEKRLPQDGRFQSVIAGREADLRVSTMPTVLGEKVAMRVLDKGTILIELEQLGFLLETLTRFREIIKKPYGIVLVTGPTSSGKTTTLYSALHTINSIEKNILTIEDPVEFHLKSVNQVQVNPRAGLTFAIGLRSMLRQDPNVIMIGEIRDLETAEIAIQSALTGHLVFSTIHTNNASATLTRLMDMKVEPFLISASVIGVVSQRLIRIVCPKCKESFNPPPELVKGLGLPSIGNMFTFYRGKGCDGCKDTGYLGRTAIFELMTINDHIRELIMTKASTSAIRQAARKIGMQTLREDGLQKVLKGITTVEEIMRATAEEGD